MYCKRYHIISSTFSLKFKCKICVRKEVIHNFKNHTLVMWPATNLLIFKIVRVWNWTKSLLFCLRYDPLVVFRRQNHITFVFIKTMSHVHLVQMAYDEGLVAVRYFQDKRKEESQRPTYQYSCQRGWNGADPQHLECKGEYCKLRGWGGNG